MTLMMVTEHMCLIWLKLQFLWNKPTLPASRNNWYFFLFSSDKGQPRRDFIFSQLYANCWEDVCSANEGQGPKFAIQWLEHWSKAYKWVLKYSVCYSDLLQNKIVISALQYCSVGSIHLSKKIFVLLCLKLRWGPENYDPSPLQAYKFSLKMGEKP